MWWHERIILQTYYLRHYRLICTSINWLDSTDTECHKETTQRGKAGQGASLFKRLGEDGRGYHGQHGPASQPFYPRHNYIAGAAIREGHSTNRRTDHRHYYDTKPHTEYGSALHPMLEHSSTTTHGLREITKEHPYHKCYDTSGFTSGGEDADNDTLRDAID